MCRWCCSHSFVEIHLPKNASRREQHCIDHGGLVAIDSGRHFPDYCHSLRAGAAEMDGHGADEPIQHDALASLTEAGLLLVKPMPSSQWWLRPDFLDLMAFLEDMDGGTGKMVLEKVEAGVAVVELQIALEKLEEENEPEEAAAVLELKMDRGLILLASVKRSEGANGEDPAIAMEMAPCC